MTPFSSAAAIRDGSPKDRQYWYLMRLDAPCIADTRIEVRLAVVASIDRILPITGIFQFPCINQHQIPPVAGCMLFYSPAANKGTAVHARDT
jgi:hypothetical protein